MKLSDRLLAPGGRPQIVGILLALLGGGLSAAAPAAPEPAAATAYSWGKPHARVLPTGDLEWAPEPFVFAKGSAVRYIDFAAGDDDNAGTSPQQPWRHHPCDGAATGKAGDDAGADTYVFKRGVIYRGALRAKADGVPGRPIRLTSDPGWGEGEAAIYGSTRIGGQWRRCGAAEAPGIPEPGKVWFSDLGADFDADKNADAKLSALWVLAGAEAVRLHIARDPNWALTDPDDPTADWYRWDTFQGVMNQGWLADPARWAGKPADFFAGARLWTQHKHLMGTPHTPTIKAFDPGRGAFQVAAPGGAQYGERAREAPVGLKGLVRYYIENVPAFLDAPGEYYFVAEGERAGRLYLRLPGDADPNGAVLEAAQVRCPIEIRDHSQIEVSGLTFRFNDPDDGDYMFPAPVAASPCVRVIGNCRNVTVRNCRFYDVMGAVVAFARPTGVGGPAQVWGKLIGPFQDDVMDGIVIADNDVRNVDRASAIGVFGSSESARGERFGVLQRVDVLRNRVVNSGFRPGESPTSSVPAIGVYFAETAEIAGNIVDTSWGNGIFTISGKASGAFNDVPLTRLLIHHNRADNTMLGCNDYGGIEMFQGGPAYIYNNVSRNAVGTTTFTGGPLGYNLYLDGGFKACAFNNILAGKVKAADPEYHGHCGYFMVFGFLDHFFNNTVYGFEYGMNGSSGNRSCILGNVIARCAKSFIGQNRPGDASMLGGGDTGEMGSRGIPTMAYGRNVFWGQPAGAIRRPGEKALKGAFGFVGGTKAGLDGNAEVYTGETVEELRAALAGMKARVADVGVHVAEPPLADPAKGDYRPTGAGVAGLGVRFFVPWGLAGVVGEWNFYRSEHAPGTVPGEDFYMRDEHFERRMYYFIPRNDLTVANVAAADYAAGPLEDWIAGALRFDGKSRYAALPHAELVKDVTYPITIGEGRVQKERGKGDAAPAGTLYEGKNRKTVDMGTNNFLVEVVFRTEPGHAGGVIVGKCDGAAGYELAVGAGGRATLGIRSQGSGATVAGPAVNDGGWHHLIVELDRATGGAVFYLDGKAAGRGSFELPAAASLANGADFLVGKGRDGRFFAGAIDFLRLARGTLADAKTGIEELYAWEFDGPHLRDFAGRKPAGQRDAGALAR